MTPFEKLWSQLGFAVPSCFRRLFRPPVITLPWILIAVGVSTTAYAWDGSVVGIPGEIDVTGGGNYDFRVFFNPSQLMCGNTDGWAYLNAVDPSYSVYVALLIASKTQGSIVTIYTNRDANGYCHIGYITAA